MSHFINNNIKSAHVDTIKRLVQSLCKEKVLGSFYENNCLIVLLPGKKILKVNDVKKISLNRYQINGVVQLCDEHANEIKIMHDAIELLDLLPLDLAVKEEIENNIQNTIATLTYIEKAHQLIREQAREQNSSTLIEWVKKNIPSSNASLFFEQFAYQGHPYHPCNKTKLGFSATEVFNYAPEFQSEVKVYLSAIHQSCVHIELTEEIDDYKQWFAKHYAIAWQHWCEKLQQEKISIEEYLPFPIHPWQQKHKIPLLFKSLIEKQQLFLFTDVYFTTTPTLSFRTLSLCDDVQAPHLKLSVAVQATSALRTISMHSVNNTPKVASLLSNILQQDRTIARSFRIVREQIGLHVKDEEEKAKNLSVLFRENPNALLKQDEMMITVAALFTPSPITNVPLCIELMQLAGVANVHDARIYFRHYVDLLLSAYLDFYLCYGVALEGHQQNTLAVFNSSNHPVGLIARDLSGLRIFSPIFESKHIQLNMYPNSVTYTQDLHEVRSKLLHSVYQVHLGEWVYHLADHFDVDEHFFWQEVKASTEKRFHDLKSKIDSTFYQSEKNAILNLPWPGKALLSMRLKNTVSKHLFIEVENPLACEHYERNELEKTN